jgi:hypothetical protein
MNTWLTVAASLVNADRWVELTNIGIELVTVITLCCRCETSWRQR